jgi:MFS family permease
VSAPHASRPSIPRPIWTLGFVSLLTDLGSEMVHSLLPILLVGGLGASALAIGLIEGGAAALVLVTRVFSGWLSDAIGRRKPLVLLGYGLAALAKPLFPLAGSVATIAAARYIDRFGKGIRGAPRDALIGDLAPEAIRGACFGLRQSMDTIGAVLGPLLAVGLLLVFVDDIKLVLWVAAVPGVIAVLLLLRIREPGDHERVPVRLPLTRAGLAGLGAPYWRVVAAGGLVALARFAEAFLILRADERGLPLGMVPLVLALMSLVYALTAYPVGWLSDRMSRRWLLAAGLLALLAADLALALADGLGLLFAGVALWGLHMGLTQGLLARMVADVAPAAHRGTAFGMFHLVAGVAVLAGSALAGAMWDAIGPSAAFATGAALSLLALVAVLLLLPAERVAAR